MLVYLFFSQLRSLSFIENYWPNFQNDRYNYLRLQISSAVQLEIFEDWNFKVSEFLFK